MEITARRNARHGDTLALCVTNLELALRFADTAKLPLLGAKISDVLETVRCELERLKSADDDAKRASFAAGDFPRALPVRAAWLSSGAAPCSKRSGQRLA